MRPDVRLGVKAPLFQDQLGLGVDLRRTYVSIVELGQQQPTFTTILKLSKALGTSGRQLVNWWKQNSNATGSVGTGSPAISCC